ncbi:MAG: 8-amino-7-oxononanoate synthase, partial [Sphingomonas bacterium]|nr:8-amino-7-oxononanoate synthase [Sphingomonas bacterium]
MAALDTFLAAALDRIDARSERRRLRPAALATGGRIVRDGRTMLDASSNDYLGLSHHPALIERAREWTARLGTGTAASRLVIGTIDAHLAVEAKVAAFKGCEAALLFASGWQANAAVLAALL